MEKKNNIALYVLIGIIIGLLVAVLIVLLTGDRSSKEVNKDNIEEKEQIKIETDPVEYFTNVSKSSDENTLKEGFVKIVDFLFYDEEINGVTFSELKDEAKLKLYLLALKIDSKIDEHFPGYKETITNGTKKIYNNVKAKVIEGYIFVTDKICSNNESLCENAKKDFESLKESFGITWDYLKEIGKNAKDKLKNWYEDFRIE